MRTGRPAFRQKEIILYLQDYHKEFGQYPNNKHLADYFNVNKSSISQTMDKIENKGLITRKKAKVLSVTKIGLEFVNK